MLAIACSRDVMIPNMLDEATREIEALPLSAFASFPPSIVS
jgi:hypothetical protein